jgi:hypothetical protein
MKSLYAIAVFGVLITVLLVAGCTNSSSQVQTQASVPTTVPATATMQAPPQTQIAFPNALDLNQYVTFGSGDQQGKATVYRYQVKPTYDWTSPSWNSVHEQLAASQPNDLQRGHNRETPQNGNTFLFVYIRVQNTGTKNIFVPSAKQFVVFSDGKSYNYSPIHSSDVVIDNVTDPQFANQNGQRDPIEYVQPLPGEHNIVDGYLIYEIPAPVSPGTTYVVSTIDYQKQNVWKLG